MVREALQQQKEELVARIGEVNLSNDPFEIKFKKLEELELKRKEVESKISQLENLNQYVY